MLEQSSGYVAKRITWGIEHVSGDIVLFIDDDAIPPPDWIKTYVNLHSVFSDNVACICSRDIYFDIERKILLSTPDDSIRARLYRQFVRQWFEPPHSSLIKYRLGVYITRKYEVTCGPSIPYQLCYSLPFRGVNLSFKVKH